MFDILTDFIYLIFVADDTVMVVSIPDRVVEGTSVLVNARGDGGLEGSYDCP